MNNLCKFSILICTIAGLIACNKEASIEQPNKFRGKWKGVCETGSHSYSFMQEWVVGSTSRDIRIKLWKQPNCPSNLAFSTVVLKTTFFSSYKHTRVSNICEKGFATKTDTKFGFFSDGHQSITINTEGNNTDKKIRNKLASLNISNTLPQYDLICLDTQGRLRIGNLRSGDGITEATRPNEMDSIKSYTKQ